MKRLILVALYFFIGVTSHGHMVFRSIIYSLNAKVLLINDSDFGIDHYQEGALLMYLHLLNKQYFNDTANIKVIINIPYTFVGHNIITPKKKYIVSTNKNWFIKSQENSYEHECREAAILYYYGTQLEYRQILQRVYFALNKDLHKSKGEVMFIADYGEFVKVNASSDVYANSSISGSYDFVRVLNFDDTKSLRHDDIIPDFEDILSVKYKVYSDSGKLGYYIKNDSFHLFNIENKIAPKHNYEIKLFYDIDTTDEVLYSFKNIKQILHDSDHYVIVTDDTTFYYYNYLQKELKGPFVIPPAHNKYLPFRRFERFCSEVNSNNDSILSMNVECLYGSYNLQFNPKSQTITVDTASFYPNMKTDILMLEQEEAEAAEYLRQIQLKKYYMLALLVFVIGLNSFLALSKRL